MPYNVLDTITEEERLKFSQNFPVPSAGILDVIFPNVKTKFWKAEYYRLMSGQNLLNGRYRKTFQKTKGNSGKSND